MTAPTYSPWFPALVPPHRPGWYEIVWCGFTDAGLPNGRWRWDGAAWRDDCNRLRELWPGDLWRGLAAPADSSEG